MFKVVFRIFIAMVICLPVLAWAYVKPIRVVTPELVGLTCITSTICIDDLSRIGEATVLYNDAFKFVNERIGFITNDPLVVFCSTKECSKKFGLYSELNNNPRAIAVGTYGIVISHQGWESYIVRHEVIHHLQSEILGVVNAYLTPVWFIEGMAYSLSEDPRSSLPKSLEDLRVAYEAWGVSIEDEMFWVKADSL